MSRRKDVENKAEEEKSRTVKEEGEERDEKRKQGTLTSLSFTAAVTSWRGFPLGMMDMRHSLKWYLSSPAIVWGSSTCIRSTGSPVVWGEEMCSYRYCRAPKWIKEAYSWA